MLKSVYHYHSTVTFIIKNVLNNLKASVKKNTIWINLILRLYKSTFPFESALVELIYMSKTSFSLDDNKQA